MHVRRRLCHVPKYRRFKRSFVGFDLSLVVSPQVRQFALPIYSHTDVVKLSIGKQCEVLIDRVAGRAIAPLRICENR